jgi:hypothetical protein
MENEELRKLLQQLHDEIEKTQTVDEKGTEILSDLDGDIRALLERSEWQLTPIQPSIVQRLDAVLLHFEVTHPDLTVMISKLLDTLSNAGI